MAITLGTITLPNGLIWTDEFSWHPIAQALDYGLTGSLIVEQASRLAGRPITLAGNKSFTWIGRTDLAALQAALATGLSRILTLHDNRTFTVIPAADPIAFSPLPRVLDSGYANPSSGAWYVLESLKLIEV